jgi:hypothetical protein
LFHRRVLGAPQRSLATNLAGDPAEKAHGSRIGIDGRTIRAAAERA